MKENHTHIPMDQLMDIESKITNKDKILSLLKKFTFSETTPLSDNLKTLTKIISQELSLS